MTDIMIRQRSTLLDDHLLQGRGAKREVRRQLAYQLATRGGRPGTCGYGTKYQTRMNARPGGTGVDMVGDGRVHRFPCMTSRHSSDLSHAGQSSWSVVASHWGSCEMGRPVIPMHAVRDGVWRTITAPSKWTEGFVGLALSQSGESWQINEPLLTRSSSRP